MLFLNDTFQNDVKSIISVKHPPMEDAGIDTYNIKIVSIALGVI